jgi:hypothetical protein
MAIALPDISPEVAESIRALTKRWLEGPDSYGVAKAVQLSGALPIHGSIGGVLYIRADGVVLGSGLDCDKMPEVETERGLWAAAYVSAAEKYPELRSLRPNRPASARDCPECSGSGELFDKCGCGECWTLGWRNDAV